MGSNTGDTGDTGDSGNAGASVAVVGFADRVDLPFAVVADPDKPGRRISASRIDPKGSFAPYWSGEWKAWRILADFTDTPGWRNRQGQKQRPPGKQDPVDGLQLDDWTELLPKIIPDSKGKSTEELVDIEIEDMLLAAETERADALGEIFTQSGTFVPDFTGLLDIRPGSFLKTLQLVEVTVFLGGFVAQHFKWINQRRRPSHVCPALKPPIPVPGHASYPSGHATQAFLVAGALREAFEGCAQKGAMPAVNALAERIARNREIAGVHYRSDSEAGRRLAKDLMKVLRTVPSYQSLIDDASREWGRGR